MTVGIKKKTIGEFTFELSELPAFTALTAFQRFLAIAGPLLPTLATAFKLSKGKTAAGELTEEDRGKLIAVIADTLPGALAHAKPDEVLELAKVLLEPCMVQPKGGKLVRFLDVGDELLRGRLPILLQLMAWAVGVHFGSFFAALGASALAAPAVAPSSSSQTS
jgi:hypothetical protein